MRGSNNKRIILLTSSMVSILVIIILVAIFFSNKNNVTKENELEGNITFVSNRTDKKEELDNLIMEFEEMHPKVKIELELLGEAEDILYKRAIVNEMPDVTLVPSGINGSEYYKYFLAIDDLGFNSDNIYNYYVGVSTDKKLYTLTTSMTWTGIIYNKQVFQDAGIEKVPVTIEEFYEVCRKIKSIGITPMAINFKNSWRMEKWINFIPYLLDPQLETKVIYEGEDILSDNSSIFKSLDFVRDIVQNEYCEEDMINYDWRNTKEDIRDGKLAMFVGSSDFRYQLEDLGMDINNIGMFPFMGSSSINIFGDYKFAISKNTSYPEVAKEFLKFLFEDDRYANAVNILSPLKDSEKNIQFFNEIQSFNLPLELYGENIEVTDNYYNNAHEYYEELRKSVGLDYRFVQAYSTVEKPEELRDEINYKWNELKNLKVSE